MTLAEDDSITWTIDPEIVALLNQRDDQVGFRALNVGPNVTPETAMLEAVNPKLQAVVDDILWDLRQRPLHIPSSMP